MRFIAIATLLFVSSLAAPVVAQSESALATTVAKRGDTLRDANLARIGGVTRVYPDGGVQVIYGARFVVVPGSTLSSDNGKLKTSLTRKDIAKL